MRSAVFFDRDGTLNRCFAAPNGTTRPPADLAELALVDDAVESCSMLRSAGYALFVVTNQPDVRRGTQTIQRADELSGRVAELLQLDDWLACYHDDADRCRCRKPAPGLILTLAERHHLDLPASWTVGDRPTDIEAGTAAGCRTVLVGASVDDHGQDHSAVSLLDAANHIIHSNYSRRLPCTQTSTF